MGWRSIEELRDQIDRYRSIEWALCQVTGAWAGDDANPVARRNFAAASARHAWHLQLWNERRPQINTVEPAPSPAAWVGERSLTQATTTADRANALAAAATQLQATYEAHRESVDPLTDPPTAEVLRRILA